MTRLDSLSSGDNPPDEINVMIEIPSGSSVKYEVDSRTGAVFVDRFLYTATHYPFNYGFIPQTLEDDGDPLDVVVITQTAVYPMTVIRSRPIGVLLTEDENGRDVKIIAAPSKSVDAFLADIQDLSQVPNFTRNQIEHFFKQYKEFEPSKYVRVLGWESKEAARRKIMEAISFYKKSERSG